MSESAPAAAARTRGPGRIEMLDAARGIALAAMIVYHFSYDLSFFRLIETDIVSHPGWRLFARCIAGSFLTIVGFSFVLSTRNGLNREAWLRRVAMVAGAALLITVATRIALPENFIFFGILHHIALASLLAPLFLRAPAPLIVLAALLSFALPWFVASPLLDPIWLSWLGFSRQSIHSADFVPLFPWFGWVLTGMVLARLALAKSPVGGWTRWRASAGPVRLATLAGRHSLSVYLLHQPILIGTLLLAMTVAGWRQDEARPFLDACQRSCVATGSPDAACRQACSCMVDRLKSEDLWQKALANTFTPRENERAAEMSKTCFR